MAPRLSRWIALTIVAVGVIATTLSSTGGTPIVFLSWGRAYREDAEVAPVFLKIQAVKSALSHVRYQRRGLEERKQLTAAIAGTGADPLVLRQEGGKVAIDRLATAVADSFWKTFPDRQPGIRTVVIQVDRNGSGMMSSGLDERGVCIARSYVPRSPAALLDEVRSRAGECILAEQFGPPGLGFRRWGDNVSWRGGYSWDRTTRNDWFRGWMEQDETTPSAWFNGGAGFPYYASNGYAWYELNRLEVACVVGRPEQCVPAAGVGREGWPTNMRRSWNLSIFPTRMLPRELFASVGGAKFGEIWTSDDPISVSYARVVGKPMDDWLMEWAQRRTGTIRRDNGLSLVGWLGALLWITLFTLLLVERLKQRTVS